MTTQQAVYVDHMGSDASVVDAARISFDKLSSMFSAEENAGLIRFLARGCSSGHWDRLVQELRHGQLNSQEIDAILKEVKRMPEHWTPFAHTAISLRMAAPVPIRTQCFKHKQGLVENEESRRYISSRPELFVPDYFRLAPEGSIKQGSGGMHPHSEDWLASYEMLCQEAIELYMAMIEDGVAPEQARFALPQGCIVQWRWTGNLYAFANFFNKRTDSHAQGEIRDLAKLVGALIEPLFPVSWKALTQ
jgi:thymidylate synthase (FAD)